MRTDVPAGRGSGVPRGDEDPVHSRLGEAIDDLRELGSAVDHPCGQVGHGAEAKGLELLGRGQRRLKRQSRRRGHRDLAAGSHVLLDAFDDSGRGQYLVAGGAQQPAQR